MGARNQGASGEGVPVNRLTIATLIMALFGATAQDAIQAQPPVCVPAVFFICTPETPDIPGTAFVSGRVIDASTGEPVAGACIDALSYTPVLGESGLGWVTPLQMAWLDYGFAQSAEDGTYKIAGLVPGTYVIRFSDFLGGSFGDPIYCANPTGGYATQWYEQVSSFEDATPVLVGPVGAEEINGVLVRLSGS